jgi:hypothetical protein
MVNYDLRHEKRVLWVYDAQKKNALLLYSNHSNTMAHTLVSAILTTLRGGLKV